MNRSFNITSLRSFDPRFQPGRPAWHESFGPAVIQETAPDGQSHTIEVVQFDGDYPVRSHITVPGIEVSAA